MAGVTSFDHGLARLVAHEVDHLHGVLYRSQMRPGARLIPVADYGEPATSGGMRAGLDRSRARRATSTCVVGGIGRRGAGGERTWHRPRPRFADDWNASAS